LVKPSLSIATLSRCRFTAASPVAFKNVAEGAATQCYVATRPELAGVSGEYFADCNVAKSSELSRDSALAEKLWAESERIVARAS